MIKSLTPGKRASIWPKIWAVEFGSRSEYARWGPYSIWIGAARSHLHQSAWIQGCCQQLQLNVTENICVSFSALSLTLSPLGPGLMCPNRAEWGLILNKTQGWSKSPVNDCLCLWGNKCASISRYKGYRGEYLSTVSCCFCALALGWTVYQPFGLWNVIL